MFSFVKTAVPHSTIGRVPGVVKEGRNTRREGEREERDSNC